VNGPSFPLLISLHHEAHEEHEEKTRQFFQPLHSFVFSELSVVKGCSIFFLFTFAFLLLPCPAGAFLRVPCALCGETCFALLQLLHSSVFPALSVVKGCFIFSSFLFTFSFLLLPCPAGPFLRVLCALCGETCFDLLQLLHFSVFSVHSVVRPVLIFFHPNLAFRGVLCALRGETCFDLSTPAFLRVLRALCGETCFDLFLLLHFSVFSVLSVVRSSSRFLLLMRFPVK